LGIPPDKQALLDRLVQALETVPGLAAIALGGSHARGTHRPDSDLDIGLYYREANPFPVDDIRRIARTFAAEAEPTVTNFYEWGPFVNGGAWIQNPVTKIDFLYRNLDQLEGAIADAEAGNWDHNFDQQPPFGFRTVTTLGEIQCCKPLHDPEHVLARLKARVATFPPLLKARIVTNSLWAAEFSLMFAENFARAGDVPNAVGCMTRIFHYLVHALFALNETYLVADKGVLHVIARFQIKPNDFGGRMSAILGSPGTDDEQLARSVAALKAITAEAISLAGKYKPKFVVPR
jgi:hypothetical protein